MNSAVQECLNLLIMRDAEYTIRATKEHSKRDLSTPQRLAANAILTDCFGRGGLKHEFGSIEPEVIEDILDMWSEIIKQVMETK